MPRCANCGKVNRDGSLFCQDCGHRLDEVGAAPAAVKPVGSGPVAAGDAPAGATCPSCGVVNPAGMNFCKMCGTPLPKPAPMGVPRPATAQAQAAPGGAGRAICPHCGGETPTAMPFCQHCGQRVAPAAPPRPAAGLSDAVAATMAAPGAAPQVVPVTPTPPAGVRVSTGQTSGRQSAGAAYAATVMPTPGQLSALLAAQPPRGPTASAAVAPKEAAPPPVAPAPAPPAAPASMPPLAVVAPLAGTVPGVGAESTLVQTTAPTARLIVVQSDGSDGAVHELSEDQVDLGRAEGALAFPDDRFLAPRHARLEKRDGRYVLVPLYLRNGIYVRLREPCDLNDGDTFLVGKQVFRFERVPDVEREPSPAVEHGVQLFGTPARAPWARLFQVTVAGVWRDVYNLTRSEIVLGREEGDYVFPDDEFMSRRHVAITENRGRASIEDLGSSNGTYLRLNGERELRPGDMVRLGDQLLRFESLV
jgi:pSer/pThr/pTyr-binding forkhead associated (FHA) protein